MVWLRHYYHKRFGRHGRFHLAVLLTIVVVTYLFVPWLASVLDAVRGYSPGSYEPKDLARQDYLVQRGLSSLPAGGSWSLIVNVILVLLMVIVWMTLFSRGGARRQ